MKKVLYIFLSCLLFVQCDYREIPVNKKDLGYTAQDCRAFQGTPAWDLAKAVDDNDTSKIIKILKVREPLSLHVITLLDKPDRRVVELKADYSLFTIPDYFVIGYGLDYGEFYRNLPYIAEFAE